MKRYLPIVFSLAVFLTISGCSKSGADTSSLYTPTSSNVTSTATLKELQQGRVLYINNCGQCHSLVSPDAYTPAQWRSVLPVMTPRTNMSASDVTLVTKYVTKGN
jgi:mono/diheme cytochrome c family protein